MFWNLEFWDLIFMLYHASRNVDGCLISFNLSFPCCLRVMKHGRECKRAANKMRAKYDRLGEWLSKERSAYTPEAFAVHRTARDNTRKRVRYVMVRWRDSGWGGICGLECLVPKCLRASRYWHTSSNVCLVISRYLRRLRTLLKLFPSVLSPHFRRPLGRTNLHRWLIMERLTSLYDSKLRILYRDPSTQQYDIFAFVSMLSEIHGFCHQNSSLFTWIIFITLIFVNFFLLNKVSFYSKLILEDMISS